MFEIEVGLIGRFAVVIFCPEVVASSNFEATGLYFVERMSPEPSLPVLS